MPQVKRHHHRRRQQRELDGAAGLGLCDRRGIRAHPIAQRLPEDGCQWNEQEDAQKKDCAAREQHLHPSWFDRRAPDRSMTSSSHPTAELLAFPGGHDDQRLKQLAGAYLDVTTRDCLAFRGT